MANRARPRCPHCQAVLQPIYRHAPRGKAFLRLTDSFVCFNDGTLARGRHKTRFL